MSEKENENKTVRVPTFDGDESKYQKWWIRFRAYARLAGFTKAIDMQPDPDLPATQTEVDALTGDSDEIKRKRKAANANDLAMASLTLAFTSDDLLDVIMEAQTEEWPDGQACLVTTQLVENINRRTQ